MPVQMSLTRLLHQSICQTQTTVRPDNRDGCDVPTRLFTRLLFPAMISLSMNIAGLTSSPICSPQYGLVGLLQQKIALAM